MALLPRNLLVSCFEDKLGGQVSKVTEHIFYNFMLNGKVVANTHISSPNKYHDFDDPMVSKIARELGATKGLLDRSSRCDPDSTRQIIDIWRLRLPR
jgi:hypothetical protein